MAEETTATLQVSDELKTIGDQIADLTLKQARDLSEYLMEEHGIEPAAGGAVVIDCPCAGVCSRQPRRGSNCVSRAICNVPAVALLPAHARFVWIPRGIGAGLERRYD